MFDMQESENAGYSLEWTDISTSIAKLFTISSVDHLHEADRWVDSSTAFCVRSQIYLLTPIEMSAALLRLPP